MGKLRLKVDELSSIDNIPQDALDTISDIVGELNEIIDDVEGVVNESKDIITNLNECDHIDLDDILSDLTKTSKILY